MIAELPAFRIRVAWVEAARAEAGRPEPEAPEAALDALAEVACWLERAWQERWGTFARSGLRPDETEALARAALATANGALELLVLVAPRLSGPQARKAEELRVSLDGVRQRAARLFEFSQRPTREYTPDPELLRRAQEEIARGGGIDAEEAIRMAERGEL